MLKKGAIERVLNKSTLGFYSLLFVIPKKNGKLHLVIDLRSLNRNLRKEKFHMETPANLRHSIQKGDWVISRFDRCISACSNPPIVEEVSLLLLSGQSVPVSGSALRVVSEPKSLHLHSRCDDGPCSVTGLSSSPLSELLAPEERTVGPPPQDSRPSSPNNPPRLDSQPGEVRVSSNSRLCLYRPIWGRCSLRQFGSKKQPVMLVGSSWRSM